MLIEDLPVRVQAVEKPNGCPRPSRRGPHTSIVSGRAARMADLSPVGICRIPISRSTGHLRMRGRERSSRLSGCPGIVTCRMHAGSPREPVVGILVELTAWRVVAARSRRPRTGGCPRSAGFEHRASADRERGWAQRPRPARRHCDDHRVRASAADQVQAALIVSEPPTAESPSSPIVFRLRAPGSVPPRSPSVSWALAGTVAFIGEFDTSTTQLCSGPASALGRQASLGEAATDSRATSLESRANRGRPRCPGPDVWEVVDGIIVGGRTGLGAGWIERCGDDH
jgi:hypothetical protein